MSIQDLIDRTQITKGTWTIFEKRLPWYIIEGARAKQAPAKRKAPLALEDVPTKPDPTALIYKSNEVKPRYYGCVTIYTDTNHDQWRVKPGKARRDEVKFPRNPASWRKLVIHVKGLKQYWDASCNAFV